MYSPRGDKNRRSTTNSLSTLEKTISSADTNGKCACFRLLGSEHFFHDGDNTHWSRRLVKSALQCNPLPKWILDTFSHTVGGTESSTMMNDIISRGGGAPWGTPSELSETVLQDLAPPVSGMAIVGILHPRGSR